ncbi:MAG TPA: hypothetical protein VFD27_04710 [Chthoniobacteraceae bacterium]|nr:hypothetical protein [Chthoniobacteraceae bacterium]
MLLLIAGIWTIVVAAQRSILWLLAVILIPFASLVLVLVESKARRPFVVSLIGVGFTLWGVSKVEQEPESSDAWARQFVHSVRGQKAEARPKPGDSPPATLEARKKRIREWQAQLQAKRAALRPNDAAAQAEFDREFQRYLAELEKVKAEMAAQRAQ